MNLRRTRTPGAGLLVSVIIPSLNQGHFIRATIDSVLVQDHPNIEILIVDGGSSDDTLEILREYGSRINWTSEPDDGQSDAINKGLRRARGEIVCYLNSDDVFEPRALTLVTNFFAIHEKTDWLFGRCRIIDCDGRPTRSLVERYKTAWAKYGRSVLSLRIVNYIPQPATFWRASAMGRIGLIDEKLHFAMDYDFWLRLAALGAPGYIDRYLASFRLHDGSKSINGARKQLAEARDIARRRGGAALLPLHRAHDWLTLRTYASRYRQTVTASPEKP